VSSYWTERLGASLSAPSNRESIWKEHNYANQSLGPIQEVVALQNRVNSLFRDLNDGEDAAPAPSFAPAVDIYEDAQKVVLKLEVPGVDQKDLDIRVGKPHADREGRAQVRSRGEGARISIALSGAMEASSAPSRCLRRWTPTAFRPATMPAC